MRIKCSKDVLNIWPTSENDSGDSSIVYVCTETTFKQRRKKNDYERKLKILLHLNISQVSID